MQLYKWTIWTTAVVLLSACQSVPLSRNVDPVILESAPYGLIEDSGEAAPEPPTAWLRKFRDPLLEQWVVTAIDRNFSLQEARFRVEAAEQQRRASRAGMLPLLNLSADAAKRKITDTGDEPSYAESFSVAASLSWELDVWGKNYDSYKAQDLLLEAERATLEATRLSLAGQVARSWYQLVTSRLLTSLFSQRVTNLSTNLDIISNGYRQGINSALDVYLARSDLASERSNLAAQQEFTRESIRQLQLLLGEYPSGQLQQLADRQLDLPAPIDFSTATFSTDSVRHRFDLRASFLSLAAADRNLAAAHKARFPSLTLSGSIGDSSDKADQLFDGDALAWNLLGGITQPLFAGGRLQATEAQQRALLRQSEQRYLQALNVAFSEIEQTFTNDRTLHEQLTQLSAAKVDAEAAEQLAFEQYRQGLVSYTAVLEAQRRAFNAQSSLLNLRNQLLQNQINLYLALGGDYRSE